jgi:hypothetical protein
VDPIFTPSLITILYINKRKDALAIEAETLPGHPYRGLKTKGNE